MDEDITSPLHILLPVATLPRDGRSIAYSASREECALVAEALKIDRVASITADLLARPFRKDGARVSGRILAVVFQKSVVSLEPVEQRINENFEAAFIRESKAPKRAVETAEIVIDPEADDPPDTFVGDKIDLGSRLFETLALAVEPYPRRPGEHFGGTVVEEASPDEAPSPFAALASITRPETKGGD